jgi:hypothetical protein
MAGKGPTSGNTLKEISAAIARQKARGTSAECIVRQLVQRGWPEASARQFVNNIQVQQPVPELPDDNKALRHQYQWRTLRGVLCVIIGFIIINAGLSSSDVYQGLYYFAMGVLLCVFETIDFMTGILGWWRNRD